MGGLLGKPPKPEPADTSFLEADRADKEEEKARVERENRGRRRAIRGRRGGFRSLLFDDERGVTAPATLG